MRARVIKHAVDGVAPGGVVELVDNLANRALITAGVIEPLEKLPAEPPPKGFKPASKGDLRVSEEMRARFDMAMREAEERIASLSASLAEVSAERDELKAALAKNSKPSKKTDQTPPQE